MDKRIYVSIFFGALLVPFATWVVTGIVIEDTTFYFEYYVWGAFFGPIVAALLFKIILDLDFQRYFGRLCSDARELEEKLNRFENDSLK